MGISLSTFLQVVSAALAAVFVIVEQRRGAKPWRSWKLWAAFALMMTSITAIVVESITTTAMDREHQADLLLIQKENAALNSLCFEIHMKPYDTVFDNGCGLQIATYSRVAASIVRTGLMGEYIHFQYQPDSGWYRGGGVKVAWPDIVLNTDTLHNLVRFEMTPFGIRSQRDGTLWWKAERLADLSQVRFEVMLRYDASLDPFRTHRFLDLRWVPVESIYLYANSYEADNLIAVLTPRERSYSDTHNYLYFHPDGQLVTDHDNFTFYVDLLQMRQHLLAYIDSGE